MFVDHSYAWTRLLILQQRASFRESTSFIFVSQEKCSSTRFLGLGLHVTIFNHFHARNEISCFESLASLAQKMKAKYSAAFQQSKCFNNESVYYHGNRLIDNFSSSSLLPHLGACSRFWSIGLSFLSFLIKDSR
jgi:hypothetical protein